MSEKKDVDLKRTMADQKLEAIKDTFNSYTDMNVKISEVCIRKMRTKWGTCNRDAWRVWLNTELAKKWLEFIEYVLIHEMVHMLERNHNEKFMSYMDMYLPNWRHLREQLNRTELGYVDWEY